MKNIILIMLLIFTSCNSLPLNISSNKFLAMNDNEENIKKENGTVKIIEVSVDRLGQWNSLEKEVAFLAPLYFWKYNLIPATPDDVVDYLAKINLREREFSVGWNTKRSLVMEVCLWANKGNLAMEEISNYLPLAAGRIVIIGDKSFLSSKITDKMLSMAIKKTVNSLLLKNKTGKSK